MTNKKSFIAKYIDKNKTELNFTSEEVEKFWSNIAEHEYEEANEALANTHTQRFDISVPELKLPVNGKLLVLWSRQGEMLPYIRKIFPDIEIVCMEISKVMLSQSKDRFPNENFSWCDLQKIDSTDSYFDAILSLEMLEHTPTPQKILDEFYRVLKPNGQLVLTCPSAVVEFHLWVADNFLNNHGEGPHRFPSIIQVKKMLKTSGFKLQKHKSTLFIPSELGNWTTVLNSFCEKMFQWFPANEFGLRQLYIAQKSNI